MGRARGRGRRLPARVYWVRRAAVLGTAFLLVFAVGRLLAGSSDGSDGSDRSGAVQAAAGTTPSTDAVSPVVKKPKGTKKPRKSRSATPTTTPLAQPSGPCEARDVAVSPEARNPVGGADVVIALALHTFVSPACTFEVSARTLTLTITSGADQIWNTRQCPRAVPTTDVVVRKDTATFVFVTWNAKRSDQTCSRLTEWARPGWYHVRVAALGGEPADEQFELARPQPQTITETIAPRPPRHTKKPRSG